MGKRNSPQKDTDNIFHIPGLRAEAVILGQTHQLTLKNLEKRQKETEAHCGDIDTGGSHSGELLLSRGQWYW